MTKRPILKIALLLVTVAILVAVIFAVNTLAEIHESSFGDMGDNLRWRVNTSTGVLTITGEGGMENFVSAESVPWYEDRELITVLNIGEGVTSVGAHAFSGLGNLAVVSLPETLEDIGHYAFYGCYTVRNLTIPSSVVFVGDFAFCGCYGLRNLNVGEGLESIGNSAFRGCYSIETLVLPDGLATIGDKAFSGCHALESVTLGNGLVTVGDESFYSCASLDRVIVKSTSATFGGRDTFVSDAWIYGYSGSTAQTYALTHGKKFVCITDYADTSIFIEVMNAEIRADETVIYALGADDAFSEAQVVIAAEVIDYVAGKPLTVYTDIAKVEFDGVATTNIAASGTETVLSLSDLTETETARIIELSLADAYDNKFLVEESFASNGNITVSVDYESGIVRKKLTVDGIKDNIVGYNSETGAISFETSYLGRFEVSRIRGLPGDVNGDGKLTAEDVAVLRRHIAGWANYLDIDTDAANVNDDDTVDENDLILVRLSLAGRDVVLVNNTELIDPAHEHEYVTVAAVAASCTSSGLGEGLACAVCGRVAVAPSYLPALAHKYENGECEMCHDSAEVSEGLAFEACDGGYAVVGIGDCADTDIVIPSVYNGNAVVAISNRAFYENSDITAVIIPTSVKCIGELAFYKNYSLESVAISEGVEKIRDKAFEYCTALESVVVPDSVTSFGSAVFMGCYKLGEATLGKGLTRYGDDVFFGCYELKTLNINAPINFAGNWFAYDCESLVTLNYAGTTEQWKALVGGDYWDNNTAEYIINCSDGSLYCHVYGEEIKLDGCGYSLTCEICGENKTEYRHSYNLNLSMKDGVLSGACSTCGEVFKTYQEARNIITLDFDQSVATQLAGYNGFKLVYDGGSGKNNAYKTIGGRSVWDVEGTTFIDYDKSVFDDVESYAISFDMYMGDGYKDSATAKNSVFSLLGGFANGSGLSAYSNAFKWVVKYVHYTDTNGTKVHKLATIDSNDPAMLNSTNSVEVELGTWVNVYAIADTVSGKVNVYVDGTHIGATSGGVLNHYNPEYGDSFSMRFCDQVDYDTHFDNFKISVFEDHEFGEWEQGSSVCEFKRFCYDCGKTEYRYEHSDETVRDFTSTAIYDRCTKCNGVMNTLGLTDTVLKLDFDKAVAEELKEYSGFELVSDTDNSYKTLDGRTVWDIGRVNFIDYAPEKLTSMDMVNVSFDVRFDNNTGHTNYRDNSIFSIVAGYNGGVRPSGATTTSFSWFVKYVSMFKKLSTVALNGTSAPYITPNSSSEDIANASSNYTGSNSADYTLRSWATVSIMLDMKNLTAYAFVDGKSIGTRSIPNHSDPKYGGAFSMRIFDVTSYDGYIDNFKISKVEAVTAAQD